MYLDMNEPDLRWVKSAEDGVLRDGVCSARLHGFVVFMHSKCSASKCNPMFKCKHQRSSSFKTKVPDLVTISKVNK